MAKSKVYILALLSMIFWGMSFVWSTIVFKYYQPITTVFLRLLLSAIILYLFMVIMKKSEVIKKKDLWLFFVSALFNPFLYFLGENFGLKNSTPTISAVIIATIPVFTPVVAYIALKERLKVINIIGIMVSFTGVMIMLVNPDLSLRASSTGISFLFMAVFSAVIYSVFLKKLSMKYSSLTIITYQNIIGLFYFLPLFLYFDLSHFLTVKPNFELVSSLIQLSVFASSLAFIFFTMIIRELGVSRANVFSNMIPVFTAIFSYIFISEVIGINKIAGIIIVIAGVLMTQLEKLKRSKQ